MTVDLLGPASDHAVTTRPARSNTRGPADTWFQDCSSSTAEDGTEYSADYFNDMLAQIRTLCRSAGIVLDNADDMVWRAVQSVGIRTGVDTGTPNHIVVPGLAPAFTAWIPNVPFVVQIAAANRNTGPVDITVNGLATKALRLPGFSASLGLGEPLDAGDLEGHQIIICAYDAALDVVAMLTPIARSVIDQALSFAIGTDFTDLAALDRWASRRRVSSAGSVAVTWPSGTINVTTLQVFSHPNSERFSFTGGPVTSPPNGSTLAAAGSSGTTRAANANTNLATLSAAFATKFNLSAGAGFLFKNFRGSISNILLMGNNVGLGLTILDGFGWSLTNVASCGCALDGFTLQGGRGISNVLYAIGNGAHGVEVDRCWLTYQSTFASCNNASTGVTGVFGGYVSADTATPGVPTLSGNGGSGAFFDKCDASLTGGSGGAIKNNGGCGLLAVRCEANCTGAVVTGNATQGAIFQDAGGDISNGTWTGNASGTDVLAINCGRPQLTGSAFGVASPAVNTNGNSNSFIIY